MSLASSMSERSEGSGVRLTKLEWKGAPGFVGSEATPEVMTRVVHDEMDILFRETSGGGWGSRGGKVELKALSSTNRLEQEAVVVVVDTETDKYVALWAYIGNTKGEGSGLVGVGTDLDGKTVSRILPPEDIEILLSNPRYKVFFDNPPEAPETPRAADIPRS